MDGLTMSVDSTMPVREVSPQSKIWWRVIEGSSQRIIVCSMVSRTTGVEVRIGYRDGAMIRTQLAFDADAARALAHTWLQALRTYGSLAVFMTSSR